MSEPQGIILYPDYDQVLAFHVALMQRLGESYYGLASEELLRSALERPRMSARYEEADLIKQAAHLLWGLIENHPFRQGNKRTGVALAFAFLLRNGLEVGAEQEDVVAMGMAVAEGRMDVDGVDGWLRAHVQRVQ